MRRFLATLLIAVTLLTPCWGATSTDSASRFAVEYEILRQPSIRQDFKRLGENYEVIGPMTELYNCIARSMGLKDRWVNPITGPKANPLSGMDQLYGKLGYRRVEGLNTALEAGIEKVVVYATVTEDASIKEVTHAAKQERDGSWTSKLGRLALIKHGKPEDLRGKCYGTPVAVYVRPLAK